ncbi:F-box protein At3g07870-like [Rhodamnia argentea]|uniref:F-box protein At3g07870-like n=1 Tax=Rhodamnia argentea TaxID=178133 RepID=A0ABM3HCH7_9MYRT|nr:F-box protein At3g07870-like [Rhodamnia argentea]
MSSDDHPKLPQDVVVEILKLLPVESLLRFRCVCRSWRSTIDDPSFVSLHLNSSSLGASNWHTVCLDWSDPVQKLCSVFSDESLTLPPQSQIEIPFGSSYQIVGSCNGLICVAEFNEMRSGRTIHLWNLFTRKHKAVLLPGLDHQWIDIGFGFDARSNDYKIVKFPLDRPCSRVEIYSLSTDSWRCLECEVPPVADMDPAVFFNGNLHWFFLKFDNVPMERIDGSIVLFDVAGEVFDEMALPEEFLARNILGYFAVLNGLLALFISRIEGYVYLNLYSVCSVWVMREYGVPESWTKLYNFEARTIVREICGFARNGELLMVTGGDERVSWNQVTRQFEDLHLSTKCDMVAVVESLVSL